MESSNAIKWQGNSSIYSASLRFCVKDLFDSSSKVNSCWKFVFFRNNEFWLAKTKSQRRKLFKDLSDLQVVIFVVDDHDCNLDDY